MKFYLASIDKKNHKRKKDWKEYIQLKVKDIYQNTF